MAAKFLGIKLERSLFFFLISASEMNSIVLSKGKKEGLYFKNRMLLRS